MTTLNNPSKTPVKNLGKLVLIVVLVVAAVALLSACGKSTPEPTATPIPPPTATQPPPPPATATPELSDPIWDRIQAAGQIGVGISADYPPFSYVDDNFVIDGFDIALIQEIGKRLDIPLDIQNMAFDGLGNALQLGQIDLAVAAISVTDEREALIDFSNVYYVSEDAILAHKDSPLTISKVEDLAGYRVGVQKGSVYETWLNETLVEPGLMPPQLLVTFQTPEEAIQALNPPSPQVNFVVMDDLPAEVAMREQPVKVVVHGLTPQRYAIAIPQGAVALQAQLNDALTQMQNDGTLAALAKTYLNVDKLPPLPTPAPTQPPPPPPPPSACLDGMAFVQDLNYPDDNMRNPPQFKPGTPFQKGWRIKNTGTCTWNNTYVLSYVGAKPANAPVGGNPVAIQGTVPPGQTYDIYINLTAPWQPGRYQSFWSLRNGTGLYFGNRIWAGFDVTGGATATPQPPAPTIYTFTARPGQIAEGACTILTWQFGGQDLAMARVFRDNQVILQDIPYSGQFQDCPLGTGRMEYRLQVDSEHSGSAHGSQFVDVLPNTQPTPTLAPTQEQPPVINSFNAQPGQVDLGQCVDLSWSFSGTSLVAAQILRNNEPIASDVPETGSQQDCPPSAGQVEYRLKVDSEFSGSAQQSQFVTVNSPAAPVIAFFNADVDQVDLGGQVNLSWSFSGDSLASAVLTRNGEVIQPDVPLDGSFTDTISDPALQGATIIYTLKVDSEFGGSAQAVVQVAVSPAQ